MMRYALACGWFRIAYWWLILTGRKYKDAPEYLERAYNAMIRAQRQYRLSR